MHRPPRPAPLPAFARALRRGALALLPLFIACADPQPGAGDMSAAGRDSAAPPQRTVVINELFPHGSDEMTDPDWAELKNVGDSEVDLSGYKVRDDKTSAELPPGTRLGPGAYLIVYCDDVPDGGGVTGGVHVPFKLGGGDEFHLLKGDGTSLDAVVWASGAIPSGQSYGRLPDGTGQFVATKPTRGARNQ